MKDLYWDTSPVAREHREQLRRDNERLRELLREARGFCGMAWSDPPDPEDTAAKIDAYFAALGDTEHE